jgi:hypothetical protein
MPPITPAASSDRLPRRGASDAGFDDDVPPPPPDDAAEAVDGPAPGTDDRGAGEDEEEVPAEAAEDDPPVAPRPNIGAGSDGLPGAAGNGPADLPEVAGVASDALGAASDALGVASDALGADSDVLGIASDAFDVTPVAPDVGCAEPAAAGCESGFFAGAVEADEGAVGDALEDAVVEDEEPGAAGLEGAAGAAAPVLGPVVSVLAVALGAEAAGGASVETVFSDFADASGAAGASLPAAAVVPPVSRFTSAGSRSMVAGCRRAFEWRIFGGLTIPCSDWVQRRRALPTTFARATQTWVAFLRQAAGKRARSASSEGSSDT